MLRGQKVVLTALWDDDSDLLYEWINEPELVRMNSTYRPVDKAVHREWFTAVRHRADTQIFAIREIETDALAGVVQLLDIHPIHHSADLRIRIGNEKFRNRGFGTEALRLVLAFAWGDLNLKRVQLGVFASNQRAIAAYKKAGFEIEGELRQACFIGNRWENLILMSCLRSDPAMQAVASNHWDDFTEAAYGRLIEAARTGGYRFADYRERPAGRHVLWRHDVDFSMHRAVRLAEIERERDAKATYFVNPHCAFYNLLEPEITALVRRIADLGHEIGLHFDSGAYPAKSWSRESLGDLISRERNLLESFLGCQIQAFAYHNPDTSDILAIDDDEIAGLVNAYGRTLRNSYGYASDSNGYWRFRPIGEVIAAGEHERLQILTHPEWWTVEPLPPRARVARCVNGRAEKALRQYDEFLRRTGRENLAQ